VLPSGRGVFDAAVVGGFNSDDGVEGGGKTAVTGRGWTPIEPRDLAWVPPRLRAYVRLDLITMHHLGRITRQFRRELKAVLVRARAMPAALRFQKTTSDFSEA